jgi:hypothetical protein
MNFDRVRNMNIVKTTLKFFLPGLAFICFGVFLYGHAQFANIERQVLSDSSFTFPSTERQFVTNIKGKNYFISRSFSTELKRAYIMLGFGGVGALVFGYFSRTQK